MLITGGSSTLSANGLTGLGNFIGYNSSGNTLTVSNGGAVVTTGQTYIGAQGGSNNSVRITGANSVWYATNVNIGGGSVAGVAGGALTLDDGALLQAANGITIASSNGSVGTLDIGIFGSNGSAGFISNTPTITFGSGSATLNFNQGDVVTISANLSGSNGTVAQLGSGTTILTGNNANYRGLISITNGTLAVGNGGNLGNSNTISNDADLLLKVKEPLPPEYGLVRERQVLFTYLHC